jgi:hypothetical protein
MSIKRLKGSPGVEIASRVVAIDPDYAAFRDLAADTEWQSRNGRRLSTVQPRDLWIEEPLSDYQGWTIASRVIADDRGVPVIAELRIFPSPSQDEDRWRALGEWKAEVMGSRAKPVPRGGVTATMLRRSAAHRVGAHQHTLATMRWLAPIKPLAARSHTHQALGAVSSAFEEAGIAYRDPFAHIKTKLAPGVKKNRGRPEKWTTLDYLRTALVYDNAVSDGGSPVQAVSAAFKGMTLAQARNMIARARRDGIIPKAPAQGTAGEPISHERRRDLERMIASQANKKSRLRTTGGSK